MKFLPLLFLVGCSTILYSPSLSAAEPYWPQWRGVDGQGHSEARDTPVEWSESKNIAWKTELADKGWSSPVIADGQIWLTAASVELVDEEEKEKRLVDNTGNQPLLVANNMKMRAICFDLATGKQLADVLLMTEPKPQPVHSLNSFASPSPIFENGRLYCHFGSYGTACLDTKSKTVLWRNQKLKIAHENGPGSSPVLHNDTLLLHFDGSDEQFVVGLELSSGKVKWKTDRSGEMNSNPQLKKCYASPLIVNIKGEDQLVSPGADWLYGYNPETGEELWKLAYGQLGFSIVPKPIAAEGKIFMCTSYMKSLLLAVDYESGDEPKIAWQFSKQAPSKPSPLYHEGLLYLISDRGVATCLEAKTGDVVWTDRVGGNFSASPQLADGKIYLCNHDGETSVLKPGREFKRLATNKLDGQLMASPVAIDGALILRTEKALYRIGK